MTRSEQQLPGDTETPQQLAQSGKVEGAAKIIILAFRDYFKIDKN